MSEGGAEDVAQLEREIAAIAQELATLPLLNQNKHKRLALNATKEAKEQQLVSLRRAAAVDAALTKVKQLRAQLLAIGNDPTQHGRRVELSRLKMEAERALHELSRE